MATRTFADLSRYQKAVGNAQQGTDLLTSLIQGAQQGIGLVQLPQQLRQRQQDMLNEQLLGVLKQAQIQDALTQQGIFTPTLPSGDRPGALKAIPLTYEEQRVMNPFLPGTPEAIARQDPVNVPINLAAADVVLPEQMGGGFLRSPEIARQNLNEAIRRSAELEQKKALSKPMKSGDSIILPRGPSGEAEVLYSPPAGSADSGKLSDVEKASYAAAAQFNREPEVRSYLNSLGSIKGMERIANDPNATASDDISMIYSFMKTLDPRSTVLASEYANAQNAAGVPEQIRQMYNKAIDGTKLSPQRRKEFVKTAKKRSEGLKHSYDLVRERYSSLPRLNPDIVVGGKPYPSMPSEDQPEQAVVPQGSPVTPLYTSEQAQDAADNGDLNPGDVYFDTEVGKYLEWR